MAFDWVYGQSRVKQLLVSSLNRKRLAHAYLFHGQSGVGKDAMALAMALSLNCTEERLEGCGRCVSCSQIMNLEYPHFRMLMPIPSRPKVMKEEKYRGILRERALQRIRNPYQQVTYSPEITILPVIGISHVRLLKREVMLKVAGGKHRVFLISHADQMTLEAANSLLKLLEEPPERTILFLTTSFPARLLETIVSRCQVVRFDSLSDEDIKRALIHRLELPEEKAAFLACMAGGSLQRGLDLAEEGFDTRRETALVFLERSLEEDVTGRMECVEGLLERQDKVEIYEMLRILQVWLRDLLHLSWGSRQRVLNIDCMDKLERFRRKWSGFDVQAGLASIQQSIDFIEKNVYLSLIMHSLSLDLKECVH